MTNSASRFKVGAEFSSLFETFSNRMYETPYAFIRENLQNAIDACRIQARRQGTSSDDPSLRIDVTVGSHAVRVHDRGNGMSPEDLRNRFWNIGASGKRNEEARAAGCVGMFGIGGFANFGVCETLTVTSQAEHLPGQRTELTRSAINNANGGWPEVAQWPSDDASPRGTIVEGILQDPLNLDELREYVQDIVRFCRELVYFNCDLISGEPPILANPSEVVGSRQTWSHNGINVTGTIYEISGNRLAVTLEGLSFGGSYNRLSGQLVFEGSGIAIHKQGFRLCSTNSPTSTGLSGFIDCDLLTPTAGRDSLDAESSALVSNMVAALEQAAVITILNSTDLINQHTRIFRYIRARGLVGHMGKVTIQSTSGQWVTLDEVRAKAEIGAKVYYAASTKPALTEIFHAGGHLVLELPGDRHKATAIQDYLSSIGATHLAGHVECKEKYTDLDRFEKAFLAELSEAITDAYQVREVSLTPGSLTEDIPVLVTNPASNVGTSLHTYVDTRHREVQKLARLGMTSLFRSMVSVFCREYLGPILRARSPKFFGNGAVNLDWLAEHRSEAWVLLSNEIAVVNRTARAQVVTASDVLVVSTSPEAEPGPLETGDDTTPPKLVKIEGSDELQDISGYYLRIPNGASTAYGDVILDCDERCAVWMGNRIGLVTSDAISTAFHFEVQLRRLLVTTETGALSYGSVPLARPIQQLFEGLYFPIPIELEEYLVPLGDQEIHIKVNCDWVDFVGSRGWEAREALD